ncbi:MAG: glycosyltransferase [Chitinophagaceae bacterium]
MPKKRLVVFIDWFYPAYKAGGPVQSVFNLIQVLKDDYEIFVITGDRDLGDEQPFNSEVLNEWQDKGGYSVMYLSRSSLSYRRIKQVLIGTEPDHIYINGMFSWFFSICPLLINWQTKHLKSTLITIAPRGMLLDSAVRKKTFKKQLFFGLSKPLFQASNIRFQATNLQEKESVLKKYPDQICFVVNNLGKQILEVNQPLQKQPGCLELVFISRIDPIKNLRLLLELLHALKGEVGLRIIGPIDDQEYWNSCQTLISSLPENIRVQYMGPQHPSMLGGFLQSAHLFVLLTKGENFGHSILESWMAGRPVLISDQTPWKNLESKGVGFDLPLDHREQIISTLTKAISWDQADFDRYSQESWKFAAQYLKEDLNKVKYYEIFA